MKFFEFYLSFKSVKPFLLIVTGFMIGSPFALLPMLPQSHMKYNTGSTSVTKCCLSANYRDSREEKLEWIRSEFCSAYDTTVL